MTQGGKIRRMWCARGLRRRAERRFCAPLSVSVAGVCVLLAFACTGLAFGQTNASTEYQVKAAFLFHFAQFVDWPSEAFKQPDSPITYCTVGDDPFQGALDASLNGKTLGARPFRVRHLKHVEEAAGCQVLFLGTDDKKALSAALGSLEGSPTLTVGETEHFAADGGMIGFCLEDNKVRFEINVRAAEHARLKISARLLALAKTVIGGQKGN